jgi:hypothetical protein
MLEVLPLILTTLAYISVFAYFYASIELKEIKANWNERRCEPIAVIMADIIQVEGVDSAENFQFCLSKFIDSSISIFLTPMMELFSKQMQATGPINDSMNYLRTMASTITRAFGDLFKVVWDKFGYIVYQAARVFYKLYSAMDRVFGIATATVFAGMSMYKGIENTIKYIFQVIIAILIILCILVIFLYFVMWPLIPLILTMIGILSATVYAGSVSGMAGSFCVDPTTLVKMKDGWKMVCDIVPGDVLADGIVEGVLKVDGSGSKCVSIDGLIISKTHLILNENTWIFAEKHPSAIETYASSSLYCLNTSTREWCVKGNPHAKEYMIRDWEELPDSLEVDLAWEMLIDRILNGDAKPLRRHPGRGLLGKNTIVLGKNKMPIRLYDVRIGEYIQDKNGFTKVIGIYSDTSEKVPNSGPNESMWYYSTSRKRWIHPHVDSVKDSIGHQLITQSGTFLIGKESPVLVRDFTEVGSDRIHETYPFTQVYLNTNTNNKS